MNSLKATFLMAFFTAVFVRAGGALGGQEGVLIAFVSALVLHGLSYRLGDKIVLRLHGARHIGPDRAEWLYRIVQDASFRAQMPMPRVYLIRQNSPKALAAVAARVAGELILHHAPGTDGKAFVTGRDAKHASVAVTEGILRGMDEVRLRGELAEGLARIQNRGVLGGTIAAATAGAIAALVNLAQ